MKILAFDTSSSACSVALQKGDDVLSIHKIAPMQQTALILPIIQELLDAASLRIPQLDAIAFGCGPGSFTGIRIASSVAQGLGFAAQKPIISISSLAALAQTMLIEQHHTHVLTAIDARMGRIYWAMYEKNTQKNMQLIGQEVLCKPDEISLPHAGEWCGAGDGWGMYEARLVERLGFKPNLIDSTQLPNAQALLPLAKVKLEAGEWVRATDAVPVYPATSAGH